MDITVITKLRLATDNVDVRHDVLPASWFHEFYLFQ